MSVSFSAARVSSLQREHHEQSSLCNMVTDSLRLYLNQLNGHEPKDLYKIFMEEVESPLLELVMQYCNGNQTKAARCLGLSRGTLRKKLKMYKLS